MTTATQGNYKAKFQRTERSVEELNKICGASFKAVKVPDNWKFKEYERVPLSEEPGSEIQSIVAVFEDKSTIGFNLKHYRLIFHTYSESLSLCIVSFKDYGKPAYHTVICNKSAEAINEFIETLKN